MEDNEYVKALKWTKENLWDGVGSQLRMKTTGLISRYICFVLEGYDEVMGQPVATGKELRQIVMGKIYPHSDYEGWLRVNGFTSWKENTECIQNYRQAFLDQLIEEFKDK